MIVRFPYTLELLTANDDIVRRKLLVTLRACATGVTVFGALVLVSGLIVGRSFGEILQRQWVLILTGPFWFVGFAAVRRWQLDRLWKTSPVFQGEHVYTIEPSGIQFVTPVSKVETSWSSITRVFETTQIVQLYSGKYIAYPIPKSAFVAPGAMEEFKRIVNASIGSRAEWKR